ncbi:MAG: FAD synthetase family protein [Bacteroides sp.]|nr:FAD synthetase family protein [Bacteroides sp.]
MQVHFSMDQIPEISFPVVTMGSFDGVHAGHRVIISRLNTLARKAGGSSVLITFHPHPRIVLYPDTAGRDLRLITTLEEKIQVLKETGLDHLIVLEFTKDFALTTSQSFVEEYLVGKLHAHTIVVGFNHFFGHNRSGNFDSLYRIREKHQFMVEEIPMQEIQNETVSSTKIRKALADGHIQRANAYLEHHFVMYADLHAHASDTSLFKRSCYRMHIKSPNKLIPPVGSYAGSFLYEDGTEKALIRISQEEILLFPTARDVIQAKAPLFIRFHKHLDSTGRDGVESEMAQVEELIY